jgi:bifunctional DNA-binding transcriptional regulator/antitoxin component of YhaV-PrlF toxin-antitoxin module
MSKDGSVVIPESIRDAHGLRQGAEFDVVDGSGRITLELVEPTTASGEDRRLTVQESLDSLPRYSGPPVEWDHSSFSEAINRASEEDWKRLEQQWHDDKDR